MEILIQTTNGKIFKCANCEAIHIEYKNLNFNFKEHQFWKFVEYINQVDGQEIEQRNSHSNFKRKIIIPVGNGNFNVLMNREELEDFKRLLNLQDISAPYQRTFKVCEFEFTSNLN